MLVLTLSKICKHKNHLLRSISDTQNILLGVNLLYPNNLTEFSPTAFLSSISLLITNILSIDIKVLEQGVKRIPELAYFAEAINLLDNPHRKNNIFYIQASLLARLYVLQIACIIEA